MMMIMIMKAKMMLTPLQAPMKSLDCSWGMMMIMMVLMIMIMKAMMMMTC